MSDALRIAKEMKPINQDRQKNASDMGFHDRVFYHAGHSDFPEFQLQPWAEATGEKAHFFTDNSAVADSYLGGQYIKADSPDAVAHGVAHLVPSAAQAPNVGRLYAEGSQVYPVRIRDLHMFDQWDMNGAPYDPSFMKSALKEAKKNKSKGIILRRVKDPGMFMTGPLGSATKPSNLVAVFDKYANHIRSVNAAFDPKDKNSRDIMKAEGGTVRRAYKKGGKVEGAIWHEKDAYGDGGHIPVGDPRRDESLAAFQKGNHPIVPANMYHGAGEHFTVFDRYRLGENTGAKDAKIGFHFSDNPSDADFYADKAAERLGNDSGVVGKYHLSIKNPLIIGGGHDNSNGQTEKFLLSKISANQYAEKHGHDAIIYPHGNDYDSGYTAIVFNPNQIKSATDNNGHFDPSNPDITKAEGGNVEGYGRGGSPEDDIIRQRLAAIPSIDHPDPAMREKALGIAQKTHALTSDYEPNLGQSFYGFKTPTSPENVQATVNPIPGVNPLNPQKQTYEQFYKTAKGGTLVNLGGDRSRLGRLTHIHGQELAWPVDLHAGPQYMLEPNKGAVWANAAGQTTRNKRLIEDLQKKGPVYGVYSPMGPKSVDSSFQMSDALMSQLAKQKPEPEMVKKFDKELRAGLFEEPAKRDKAVEKMKEWPGLDDPWGARNFLKTLPGTTRSLIVKHMDKSGYHKAGFPHVGMTRVALTDPELLKTGGNMIGHRVVELTPQSIEASAFEHNTYPEITSGRYVADIPLVQRHYALSEAVRQFAEEPHKPGVLHPYSENPNARSGFKKMTEEQKLLQNIDEPWLESVQQGLANQKKYGFKKGGIAKTTSTIHNSPIVEHALGKVSAALPALDLPLMAAKAGRRY